VHTLAEAVADDLGSPVVAATRLGGGDVAESYRFELDDGRTVFAKTHRDPPAGFFTTEAAGLRQLREPDAIAVPEVLAVSDGSDDAPPRLVLDWIDEGGRSGPEDEHEFGRHLARLHRAGTSCFGRDDGRTTGSLALPNVPASTWVAFFGDRRLTPLLRIASDRGSLPAPVLTALERTIDRLDEYGVPIEPPARLHGDLWAGNRIVDRSGSSWLIDPAFHGGHREFDLAMMQLFGGFDRACFDGYEAEWPLADGWRARVPLHQLAPLVVHAVKFGGGYVGAVERALDAVSRLAPPRSR
jgi:fructosamine-3-kinase